MPSTNEYLSFKEWTVEVEKLCQTRLKKSLWDTGLKLDVIEEAWEDGATPEEFYETDVHEVLEMQATGGVK